MLQAQLGTPLPGSAEGHDTAFQACGGAKVVTEFLHKVGASGEALLVDRAKKSDAQTVVLIQHYETEGARVKDLFEVARRKHGKPAARVLSAYGHTHDQGCHRHNAETGQCELIMTGGGGGWVPEIPFLARAGCALKRTTSQ